MLTPRLLSRFKYNPFAVSGLEWRRNTPQLLQRLPGIIGEKRYERLLRRKYVKEQINTPKLLDALVLGMADVRFEDIAELFAELKDHRHQTVRHLNTEATAHLQNLIRDYDIYKPLPKEVLDQLMYALVPVQSLDDLFLNEEKPVVVNGSDMVQENLGAISILMLYSHYLRLAEHLSLPEYWFILGKRIIDREPRVGTLLPHPNGYYIVTKNISADNAVSVTEIMRGGAYIVSLEPMSFVSNDFRPMLFCRGTRRPLLAVSGHRTWADNLRACQGSDGVILDFERVRALLNTDPWRGQPIWIGGSSLGGGHAQRLSLALLSIGVPIEELFVVSGIGLETLSLKWFKYLDRKPRKIHYFIDIEDPAFLLGDGHLGHDCPDQAIDLWCIVPPEQSEDEAEFLKAFAEIHTYCDKNYIGNLRRMFADLNTLHSTYRLWYEEEMPARLLFFNHTHHAETIRYLMDNTIGNKKWLDEARRYHLWAKHHNKFIDFLSEITGQDPKAYFERYGDKNSMEQYQFNRQQYALTAFLSQKSTPLIELVNIKSDIELKEDEIEQKTGQKP